MGRPRALTFLSTTAFAALTAAGCWSALKGDAPLGGIDGGTADADPPYLGAEASPGDASDASDAAIAQDAAPTVADFYVDHGAALGSGAYPTIHDALAAARASLASKRTLHLAAGVYDAKSGETFPIDLRGGISMVGTGVDAVLDGTGISPLANPDWVIVPGTARATLLVGDPRVPASVSKLLIKQEGGSSFKGSEAIACDRGSVVTAGKVAPDVVVSEVTIDGFEIGVRVTATLDPAPSGCSLMVRKSTFQNGHLGVLADGRAETGGAPVQRVSVQLGDGSSDGGNLFQSLTIPQGDPQYWNGAGLVVLDAVTGVVVWGNKFRDSNNGILASHGVDADETGGLDVEQNDFGPLNNAGIQLKSKIIIDRLVGNAFHDISTPDDVETLAFPGAALAEDNWSSRWFPAVRLARSNTFFANDIAITLRSEGSFLTGSSFIANDFGTAADFGRNSFRCNSDKNPRVARSLRGADLAEDVSYPMLLSLVGNEWDHAPPSRAADVNGADLSVHGATVDVSHATTSPTPACPDGRTP